ELISVIQEELLKSAKLTGIWEGRLRQIEHGEYSAPEFISQLKQMISEIVMSVLKDNSNRQIIAEQQNDTVVKKDNKKDKTSSVNPKK
ncbi:MAG: DNA topoisomerase III, partial [Muribaculaceae bacterium]|nr:DNA topoisomerase III [Muribaculaceae bacterium]